jgi:hypothetical protein
MYRKKNKFNLAILPLIQNSLGIIQIYIYIYICLFMPIKNIYAENQSAFTYIKQIKASLLKLAHAPGGDLEP